MIESIKHDISILNLYELQEIKKYIASREAILKERERLIKLLKGAK